MKRKNKHRIIGIAALIILIPAIIYLCFGIGMLSTNSPKAIELDWVKQYKIYITEQYTYLNNVNIYYQQGSVNFAFTTNKDLTLEDCKHITKITKEFLAKEITSGPLIDSGFDQLNLILNFAINGDDYTFKSSYWILQNENDSIKTLVENNYKIWNIFINDVFQYKLEL